MPFHRLEHTCCSHEHPRSTLRQAPTSGPFMTDLTVVPNHVPFWKSTIPPVYSIVLGIMLCTVTGCGTGGEQGGGTSFSTAVTPTPTTASLVWDPVPDPTVTGYSAYYGTQSAGQPGLCSYQDAQFVTTPYTTIQGLDSTTQYYFAVSAYNGLSGPCSNEVSTVTPPSS